MISRDRWGYAVALAVVAAGLLYGFGAYPLLDPDEGRNAEVAREMAEFNSYVLPRLNGLPYVDKPIVHFAAVAVAFEIFGSSPVVARLPSLFFTIGTLCIVWWFAVRLTDQAGGITAVVATAATPFTLAYSRTVIFDATLTFWVVVALVSFHEAIERSRDGQRVDLWRAAAWAAMAAAVLTKGPIGLVLPLLVALPYAWWRGRVSALIDPVAVLLLPAIVVPWVAAVSRGVPSFAEYVIAVETGSRLLNDDLSRSEPFWYFLVILPAAALPWTVVVVDSFRTLFERARGTSKDPRIVFLLFWILLPLVFFSLANSKRPQYVLPLVPGVSLLVTVLWHRARDRLPGARLAALVLVTFAVVLVLLRHQIPSLVNASAGVADTIPATAAWLAMGCFAAGVAAWVSAEWRPGLLGALALPVALIPLVSQSLMQAIGEDRSAASLAEAILQEAPSEVQVVGVHAYPLSLPFYLGRTITLVTDDATELTSNYLPRYPAVWRSADTVRPGEWWMEAAFSCHRPRVFVVRSADDDRRTVLASQLPVLATSRKYVVYGPCGTSGLARSGL